MIKSVLYSVVFLLVLTFNIFAQDDNKKEQSDPNQAATKGEVEEVKGALDGLNETYLETKATVDALKKIKISGYIQAQYKYNDPIGDSPVLHSNMTIRRGRFKVNYDNGSTQLVYQLQADEGSVTSKDIYLSFKEQYLKTFGITAGLFVRPFGFETPFSSNVMEYPERAKVVTTMLPGEEDLGVMLEVTPTGSLSFLDLKVGLFNGNGIAKEVDNNKDIIGRLGYKISFDEAGVSVDGGFSGYFGNVLKDAYSRGKNRLYSFKSGAVNYADTAKIDRKGERQYMGADIQTYFSIPGVDEYLGGSSLKAEVITGKQPGTSSSSALYVPAKGDLYIRNFLGYYISFVQNIGTTAQFVVKYDSYDPNTDLKSSQIGSVSKSGSGDLFYTDLGLGLVYHWDENVKITAYYDMITNETTPNVKSTTDLTKDFTKDQKDNAFTLRMQYKF